LATVASDFATLNVGNISHHPFQTDTLYCVQSRGLYWNKRQFATK